MNYKTGLITWTEDWLQELVLLDGLLQLNKNFSIFAGISNNFNSICLQIFHNSSSSVVWYSLQWVLNISSLLGLVRGVSMYLYLCCVSWNWSDRVPAARPMITTGARTPDTGAHQPRAHQHSTHQSWGASERGWSQWWPVHHQWPETSDQDLSSETGAEWGQCEEDGVDDEVSDAGDDDDDGEAARFKVTCVAGTGALDIAAGCTHTAT